jgi:hypothetical protein
VARHFHGPCEDLRVVVIERRQLVVALPRPLRQPVRSPEGAAGVVEDPVEQDAHVTRPALGDEPVEVGIAPHPRVETERVHSVIAVVR